jgi:glycosyltransferase involved in cell wall biosynthesis
MTAVHTLYVCYFGLREPLVQTQVLPYLRELRSDQLRVSFMTFEPRFGETWSTSEIAEQKAALAAEGIAWYPLAYHKAPSLPATLFDIAAGARKITQIMKRDGVNVLHARNHVPALMAAIARRKRPAQLVFDIRGFMPEEYTDAGVWPENGYLYRGLKRVERYLLDTADAFVLLTEKAREIVFPGAIDKDDRGRPIEVIPCCVDFVRFDAPSKTSRDALRNELGVTNRNVIVYVGSFGGWYLTDEMTRFLAVAHEQDPTTFPMILTQSPREPIVERLRNLGLGEADFLVTQVSPVDVPRYLKAADVAISLIKPCYSKQSSSPTKIAEYLASGLPIVCNAGIGDLDKLIQDNRAGVLLREMSLTAFRSALDEVTKLRSEPELEQRLRGVARQQFDLKDVGGRRYRRLYERLAQRN